MKRKDFAPLGAGIIVVAVDISALDLARLVAGEDYPLYIEMETANKALKAERIGAYIALKEIYSALFSSGMPPILRDEYGKPYFKEGEIAFNYSHINGVVAVGFMLYGGENLDTPPAIGVDIEWIIEDERARRIEKRYTSAPDYNILGAQEGEMNIDYRAARLDEVGRLIWCDEGACFEREKLSEIQKMDSDNIAKSDDITARWTILEASLKASGGGFRDLERINEIFSRTSIRVVKGSAQGRQYMLSVALYK
jgi:phosphopantetheinyl transferase